MKHALALAALVLAVSACSGPASPREQVDAAFAALGAGRHGLAAERFEDALEGLDEGDAQWLRASLGRFQALAQARPEIVQDDFPAFAEARALGASGYLDAAAWLEDHDNLVEALRVLDAGVIAHPDSDVLRDAIARLQVENERDHEVVSELRNLGYLR